MTENRLNVLLLDPASNINSSKFMCFFFQIPMAGGWADCAAKKASSLTTISKKYSIDNDRYENESTVRECVAMT